MIFAWVAISLHLPQKRKRVFPILLVLSSEPDDSFLEQFFLTDSFETQDLYMYDCRFAKSDKYSSSEVSLSSVSLFLSSEALLLFIGPSFYIFMDKLLLSSKFILSFLSLLDILLKEVRNTIVSWTRWLVRD